MSEMRLSYSSEDNTKLGRNRVENFRVFVIFIFFCLKINIKAGTQVLLIPKTGVGRRFK